MSVDPRAMERAVINRLREVIDPETGADVIRMWLIEDLAVDEEGVVRYRFRPSLQQAQDTASPLCPLAVTLALQIKEAVAQVEGVTEQEIEVVGYVGAESLNALRKVKRNEGRALMIIAVASGKGGTGKTAVAVSLALSIASKRLGVLVSKRLGEANSRTLGRYDATMLFLDCDVEQPNAHLFLNPAIERREEAGILIPEVDYDKCTFCGRCAEVCAYHAIAVVKQNVLVFPELCHGCGSCTLNCPEEAIHEVLNVTDVIKEGWALRPCSGQARGIRFAHGILNIGEAMAVPVIPS